MRRFGAPPKLPPSQAPRWSPACRSRPRLLEFPRFQAPKTPAARPAPMTTTKSRLEQLRRRGRDLPSTAAPEPDGPSADELLEPLRTASGWTAGALLILGALAPALAGDGRALLLPGVPGLLVGGCALLARRSTLRRRALLGATSVSGFLALAAAPGLSGLGSGGAASWLQPAALAIALVHLAVAQQSWSRSGPVRRREEAGQRMRDEL